MGHLASAITNGTTAASEASGGPACRVGTLLAGLDDTDRTALHHAIAAKTPAGRNAYSSPVLASLMTKTGHPVGASTLDRHRRHLCNCPTESEPTP